MPTTGGNNDEAVCLLLSRVQKWSLVRKSNIQQGDVVPRPGFGSLWASGLQGQEKEEEGPQSDKEEGEEMKTKYPPEVVALIKAAKKMPGLEAVLEPCASDGSCVCGIKKCDILALQKALKGVGANKGRRPWKAGFMGMKDPA